MTGVGVTGGYGSGTGVGVPVGDGLGEGVGVTVGVGVSCDLAEPSIGEIFAAEFIEYARADNKMTNDNVTANNRFILRPRFL